MPEAVTHERLGLDREWRLRACDVRPLRLLGEARSPAAVTGERFWAVFPSLVGTRAERRLREAWATGTAVRFELFHVPTAKWIDVRVKPTARTLWIYLRDQSEEKQRALETQRAFDCLRERKTPSSISPAPDGSRLEPSTQAPTALPSGEPLLSEIASELIHPKEPATAARNVLRRMANTVSAEFYLHHELDPAERRLRFVASGGFAHDQLAQIAELPFGERFAGVAAERTSVVVLENLANSHAPEAEPLRTFGIRTLACWPLHVGPTCVGTVTFATAKRERFTADELGLMQFGTRLLAIALVRGQQVQQIESVRNEMQRELAEKNHFFAVLSHELRTPLNPALLLATNAATNAALPTAARREFEKIAGHLAAQARLLDDLLDLTRFNHGKFSFQPQTLDVHGVLQDAVATIEAELRARRLKLTLTLMTGTALVRGDPLRLQQAFWNLLQNAVKFTPAGGEIMVKTLLSQPGELRIEISDTGIGLTTEEAAHVFEPFAQGAHAIDGSRLGGLGLGLTITRKLVELHAGRIRVISDGRDRGASFVIELPVAMESVESQPLKPVHAGLSAAGSDAPNRPVDRLRILVVEDHAATRDALRELLTSRGHEIIAAASFNEALYLARQQKLDLVIADLGLPDGSGLDLMIVLRREFGLIGVALTGYGNSEDVARGAAAGFIAHLTKPVSAHALEAALAAAIAGRN